MRVPTVLWAYRITCKNLTGQTLFILVYGVEAIMLIVPSMCITTLTDMVDREALEERLA